MKDISVYHQCGHNDVWNFDIYNEDNIGDGFILCPKMRMNKGEIITLDENGIGKFSIDIDENENYDKMKKIKISAVNMNEEKVQKEISLPIQTKKILISTDKVKYKQGEDIKIDISSPIENTRNIYLFKNDKLLKMISTDSSETTINLNDEYGLIDIYVTQNGNNQKSFKHFYLTRL